MYMDIETSPKKGRRVLVSFGKITLTHAFGFYTVNGLTGWCFHNSLCRPFQPVARNTLQIPFVKCSAKNLPSSAEMSQNSKSKLYFIVTILELTSVLFGKVTNYFFNSLNFSVAARKSSIAQHIT